ncbi:unnamed protein product [Vitrella brassicaformis CCMP3155]|uniref:GPR180/TMEM145 transmembrane domain-containing protein n=1 Tax=Vitrella brassicaformis (strain CCMP3155) TaxID=1169540 RepID=A0A0G4GM41_VITBC|nr:unnamed protein product [Vitrella brassicaformis CCMP3155]|eukprot:CEM31130.1 unnamed protein product [Vitrella brassicaformis CCMP3155]
MQVWRFVVFTSFLLSGFAEGKVVKDTRWMAPDKRFVYLSKFAFKIGNGSFKYRIKLGTHTNSPALEKNVTLPLLIFLDNHWIEVDRLPACERSKKVMTTRQVIVQKDNEWSPWVTGVLHQSIRPHVWYFAFSDCQELLGPTSGPFPVMFESVMLQEDGSQFSYELLGTRFAAAMQALSYIVMMLVFLKRELELMRTQPLHPIIQVLNVAILSSAAGSLLNMTHLFFYAHNGTGLTLCDVLSEVLSMLSQMLVTTILLLIALGYTLRTGDLAKVRVGSAPALPVVATVCVGHLVLVAIGNHMADDSRFKFHSNEGAIGWTIVCIRIALYAIFLVACSNTYLASPASRLQAFLRTYTIASSLYFLAFPLLFIVTSIFAPYLRHKIMSNGVWLVQIASLSWLATLFLIPKSQYFSVSSLGHGLLPSFRSWVRGFSKSLE